MSGWSSALNDLAGMWLGRLWHASVAGAVALGMAWLVCRVFSRTPARLQCWVWRLAYGKLLLALFCIAPLAIPLLPSGSAQTVRGYTAAQIQPSGPVSPSAVSEMSTPANAKDRFVPKSLALPAWILVAWISGALWRCVTLLGQWRKAARMRATCRPVAEPEANACCTQLSQDFGLAREPGLMTTGQVFRPLLIGILRPAIIVPASQLTGPGRENLKLVIAHELAHLAGRALSPKVTRTLQNAICSRSSANLPHWRGTAMLRPH